MFKERLLLAAVVVLLGLGCAPNPSSDNPSATTSDVGNELQTEPLITDIDKPAEKIDLAPAPAPVTAEAGSDEVGFMYEGVAYELTELSNPKIYASWGRAWINKINYMMPIAVALVAENPKCDAPSTADLSDNRSLVKKEAVFYVDCINGERFYISQADIAEPKPLVAENDMLADGNAAYTLACGELTKTKLEYPSSFKPLVEDTKAFKGSSGNMIVEIPFTSLNIYGAELPSLSRCIFSTTGETEVTLTNR